MLNYPWGSKIAWNPSMELLTSLILMKFNGTFCGIFGNLTNKIKQAKSVNGMTRSPLFKVNELEINNDNEPVCGLIEYFMKSIT